MKPPVDISVVVSTYQQQSLLPLTLAALEQQDFAGTYEVVVCDDGSNPGALACMERWSNCERMPLMYVWQPDRGYRLGRCRNNGIRVARGNFLLLLDGDIVGPPNLLSSHFEAHATAEGPIIAAGPRKWVDVKRPDDTPVSLEELVARANASGYHQDKHEQQAAFSSKRPWLGCWGFNLSMPRREEVLFDEAMEGWGGEDNELCCRLFYRHNYTVSWLDDIEVLHVNIPRALHWTPYDGDTEKISQFIWNVLYMRHKFAELNTAALMWPLRQFYLNEAGQWQRVSAYGDTDLAEAIRNAEAWFEQRKTLKGLETPMSAAARTRAVLATAS